MNRGIGVDLISISRFIKFKNPDDSSLRRIFADIELEYCFSKANPARHLAGRFAGKEAMIKAFANVGVSGFDYKEIEIINNKNGVPEAVIRGNLKLNGAYLNLSLSHTDELAIAFAVVEMKNKQ